MIKHKPGKPRSGKKTAQSRGSPKPGPVKGEETLARAALHPIHFDSEGKIDDSFITVQELKRGCSVLRKEICGEQGIHDHGNKLAKPPKTKYAGYAQIKAGEVRRIADADEMCALCVLEQALPENAAHAIIQVARGDYAKSMIREIREKLMTKMDMSCVTDAWISEYFLSRSERE